MMTAKQSHPVSSYTVAWIAALHKELAAAMVMLDATHGPPTDFHRNALDANSYTWGSIASHNVVLCSLPYDEYATISALHTAKDLRSSLPNIRLGLLVGIGAGIPGVSKDGDVTSVERDIRVGDVIVGRGEGGSPAVVQYDFRKVGQRDGQSFIQHLGSIDHAPRALRNAVNKLKAIRDKGEGGHQIYLDTFLSNPKLRRNFGYPGLAKDPLRDAVGARVQACSERDQSEVHYGVIASGNTLFKDPAELKRMLNGYKSQHIRPICAEMEAAGLMSGFPCLVVRGVSDYADTTKNDEWQGFAAAAAAAYAKEVLTNLDEQEVLGAQPLSKIMDKVKEVADNVQEVKTRNDTKDLEKILTWLCPDDTFRPPEADVSAGVKFLEENIYQRWMNDANWHLNCHGDMGVGKTYRAHAVVEHLRKKYADGNKTMIIGIFLANVSDVDKPSELLILRCILRALLEQWEKTTPTDIFDAWKIAKNDPGRLTSTALRELLCDRLKSYERRYLVIDAVDRAEQYREKLFQELTWLHQQKVSIFTTELSRGDHIRICCDGCSAFTSNDTTDTMDTYWRCMDCKDYDLCEVCHQTRPSHCNVRMIQQSRPRVNIMMEANRLEVEHFIESTLEQKATLSGSSGEDERLYLEDEPALRRAQRQLAQSGKDVSWSTIAKHAQSKASGSFLYASVYVKLLCNQTTPNHARMLLLQLLLPHSTGDDDTLTQMYKGKLEACMKDSNPSNVSTAREWLSRVLIAAHPLTLKQLQHAVAAAAAASSGIDARNKDELRNYFDSRADILLSTHRLLAFDAKGENNSPDVRFAHDSLSSYLQTWDVQAEYFGDAHERMLHSCLSYLSLDIFTQPSFDHPNSDDIMRSHPFASYAALYWGHHAKTISERRYRIQMMDLLGDKDRLECVMQIAWRARSRYRENDGWDVQGGVTALHVCAFYGLIKCCKDTLEEEDVDVLEHTNHQTPLMYACRKGHLDIVVELLRHGANINHMSLNGRTPLIEAIENCHEAMEDRHRDILDCLMEQKGLDVDSRDADQGRQTPLMLAARYNNSSLLKRLLERTEMIDAVDETNCTALAWAVRNLNTKCVRLLLMDRRTDASIRDRLGNRTALDWIAEPIPSEPDTSSSKLKIAEMLMNDRRNLICSDQAIVKAIMGGQVKLLEILAPRGLDHSYRDEHGRGFLHFAVSKPNIDMTELVHSLLQQFRPSFDVHRQDNHGASPLHTACIHATNPQDVIETIKFLLRLNADPLLPDAAGLTPLHHARDACPSPETWQTHLLPLFQSRHSIPPTLLSTLSSRRPQSLTKAYHHRDLPTFISLLSSPLPLELDPYTGSHILHLLFDPRTPLLSPKSVHFDHSLHLEFLQAILPVATRLLNLPNSLGRTPQHFATSSDIPIPAFSLLLAQHGLDLEIKDKWDITPLLLAQRNCQWQKAALLVEAGANLPSEKEGGGVRPEVLESAIDDMMIRVVVRLVEEVGGALLRHRAYGSGETLLGRAERNWRVEMDIVRVEMVKGGRSEVRVMEMVDWDERVKRRREVVELIKKGHVEGERGRAVKGVKAEEKQGEKIKVEEDEGRVNVEADEGRINVEEDEGRVEVEEDEGRVKVEEDEGKVKVDRGGEGWKRKFDGFEEFGGLKRSRTS